MLKQLCQIKKMVKGKWDNLKSSPILTNLIPILCFKYKDRIF
jgi:hypothetical protein